MSARIFISHSSKDKAIIDRFKKCILHEGLGIADQEIIYTSAPETGVPFGESIPAYIKQHIANSDFVFLMISENYRASEICLNEMGAAWALNKNVKPFLLSAVESESVGWLYQMNQCARIDNVDMLDELHDELAQKFGHQVKTSVWNRAKEEFIAALSTQPTQRQEMLPVLSSNPENEEWGVLDYRMAFEQEGAEVVRIMNLLTEEANELNQNINKRGQQLSSLNNRHPNVRQAKNIMILLAQDMSRMSDVIDQQIPDLEKAFHRAMDHASSLWKRMDVTEKQTNRASLNNLIRTLAEGKDAINEGRTTLQNLPDIEKSFIAAKKRLVERYGTLIEVYDRLIIKATELYKI